MPYDVFISSSSRDKLVADAACAALEGHNIRCWIAPRDILPGADWGSAIIHAIANARVFVLVFSSHANASPQIKREVERAVHRGIPIIPLRIEDVQPEEALEYYITTSHWLDAFTPPLEAHLNYLADVIRHILDGQTVVSVARPPASGPMSSLTLCLSWVRRYLWQLAAGTGALVAVIALLFLWLVPHEAAPAAAANQSTLSPALAAPRLAVVREFYSDLARGDGQAASLLVVPEKRAAGSFSAVELTEFYGHLPVPLVLVGDVQILPDGRVLARYVFTMSTGMTCNGSSIVTVVEGASPFGWLIQRISSPSGC